MQAYILIGLIVLIAWYISQHAKNIIPRILFIFIGLYFILASNFASLGTYFGLGLLLPHLNFLYKYLAVQFMILKAIGLNSYNIFLSFYYKTKHFFNWINSIVKAIKIFFHTTDFSQAKDSYYKENPKEERFDYSKYEQNKEYYNDSVENEEVDKHIKEELKQFYSSDPYVVLGVNSNDTKATIKKAYRNLMRQHHPDVNQDRIEEATLISQLIGNAYEKIK